MTARTVLGRRHARQADSPTDDAGPVPGAALGAVPVREHRGRVAVAGRPALHGLHLHPGRLGQDHERQVAVRRRLADPGPRRGRRPERGHAGLVRLVPPERRRAQREPVRDARRAGRARRRPRAAGGPAHGHRGLRWRVPELELHPRRRARIEPALVVLGLFLVVAWRNAGWIGLDRWFIPWTHRTMFEPKPAEGSGASAPTG